MKTMRGGFSRKRGHQHHVGDRCSNVDAQKLLAELRAITQAAHQSSALNDVNEASKQTTNEPETSHPETMKDSYKLAFFETKNVDPLIIREKCERFGSVKHCHQANGVTFALFNRRKDAQTAFDVLKREGNVVEFANCRSYVESQAKRIAPADDAAMSLPVLQTIASMAASVSQMTITQSAHQSSALIDANEASKQTTNEQETSFDLWMNFFQTAGIKQPACSIYTLIFVVQKVQLDELDINRLQKLGITEKADVDAILSWAGMSMHIKTQSQEATDEQLIFAQCRPYINSQTRNISRANDAVLSLTVSQAIINLPAPSVPQIIQRYKFDDLHSRTVDETDQEMIILNSGQNIISCIMSRDYEQFSQLTKDIQAQGRAQEKKPPYEPLLKEICLVPINGYWYRVEYQQELIENRAQVAMIDFGFTKVVNKKNIRALVKSDECLTLLCAIRDVPLRQCDKILRNGKIHAKKIKYNHNFTHSVWLNDYTENEDDDQNILPDTDSRYSDFSE